jgi:hypothetical protein
MGDPQFKYRHIKKVIANQKAASVNITSTKQTHKNLCVPGAGSSFMSVTAQKRLPFLKELGSLYSAFIVASARLSWFAFEHISTSQGQRAVVVDEPAFLQRVDGSAPSGVLVDGGQAVIGTQALADLAKHSQHVGRQHGVIRVGGGRWQDEGIKHPKGPERARG